MHDAAHVCCYAPKNGPVFASQAAFPDTVAENVGYVAVYAVAEKYVSSGQTSQNKMSHSAVALK